MAKDEEVVRPDRVILADYNNGHDFIDCKGGWTIQNRETLFFPAEKKRLLQLGYLYGWFTGGPIGNEGHMLLVSSRPILAKNDDLLFLKDLNLRVEKYDCPVYELLNL